MKTKAKILALALSLVMLVGILALFASAAETQNDAYASSANAGQLNFERDGMIGSTGSDMENDFHQYWYGSTGTEYPDARIGISYPDATTAGHWRSTASNGNTYGRLYNYAGETNDSGVDLNKVKQFEYIPYQDSNKKVVGTQSDYYYVNNRFVIVDFDICADGYIDTATNKLVADPSAVTAKDVADGKYKLSYPDGLPFHFYERTLKDTSLGTTTSSINKSHNMKLENYNGAWRLGSIPLSSELGVWNHITLVYDIDTDKLTETKVHAYIDGVFCYSMTPMTAADYEDTSKNGSVTFFELRLNYEDKDFSMGFDNVTTNYYSKDNYKGELIDAFAGDNIPETIVGFDDVVYSYNNYNITSSVEAPRLDYSATGAAGTVYAPTPDDLNGKTFDQYMSASAGTYPASSFKLNKNYYAHWAATAVGKNTYGKYWNDADENDVSTSDFLYYYPYRGTSWNPVGTVSNYYHLNNDFMVMDFDISADGYIDTATNMLVADPSAVTAQDVADGKYRLSYLDGMSIDFFNIHAKSDDKDSGNESRRWKIEYDDADKSWAIIYDNNKIPLSGELGAWNHITIIYEINHEKLTDTKAYAYVDGVYCFSMVPMTKAQFDDKALNAAAMFDCIRFHAEKVDFSIGLDNATTHYYAKGYSGELASAFAGGSIPETLGAYNDIVYNYSYKNSAPDAPYAASVQSGEKNKSYYTVLEALANVGNGDTVTLSRNTRALKVKPASSFKVILGDGASFSLDESVTDYKLVRTSDIELEVISLKDVLRPTSYALGLSDQISMRFVVPVASLEGFTDPVLRVSYNGASYDLAPEVENGLYTFYTSRISPNLADTAITYTLSAKADSKDIIGNSFETSIKAYCYQALAYDAVTEIEKDLIADVLNYCAAAQTAIDGITEGLVNEGLSDYPDHGTKTEPVIGDTGMTHEGDKSIAGISVGFNNGLRIRLTSVEGRTLLIKDASGNILETVSTFTEKVNGDATDHYAYFKGSSAAQLRKLYTFELVDGEGNVVDRITNFSFETYAFAVISDTAGYYPDTLRSVMRAMMVYGDSASNYINNH